MSLRTKYITFVVIVHAVIIFLIFWLLKEEKLYFILSEVLVLISLLIAIQLYHDFIQPLKFLMTGIEAIRDRDFTVKFRKVGKLEMDQLIDVYNAMIEQLRAERTQVLEQHYFLDKLIQASPIAVIILDFDNNITNLNPKARELFRFKDNAFLNRPLVNVEHPIVSHLISVENGESKTVQINGVETYKIQRSFFLDRGFSRPFLMVEELTAEIMETEKKAYGKVIRMMAHEINNSIGAVNSILNVTRSHVKDPDLSEALTIATERNDKLNHFMRRFADIVRLPLPNKEAGDVIILTDNIVQLMSVQARAKGLNLTLIKNAKHVNRQIDTEQMEQVLVNIIKNAIEACVPGREIIVEADTTSLLIRNNGAPIPEEVEQRLFTPFFSSKPEGQGIGLTLIRDILMNHGFTFSLKTEEDGWTVFRINW